MKSEKFCVEAGHDWYIVYDQDEKRVIDSNVYALQVDGHTLLCDPGGFEVFPQVFSSLVDHVEAEGVPRSGMHLMFA